MANTETKTARGPKAAADAAQRAGEKIANATHSAARDMADAAFAYPTFEVPEAFRSFAEQGLNQTREVYARVKAAAEEATDLAEESFEATRDGMRDVQFKALDAARANTEASFDLVRKLMGVTNVADAIQLQTAYARERFEAFVDYSKDVQATLSKVGVEVTKPAKTMFDRAMTNVKAA
jgi:phasin